MKIVENPGPRTLSSRNDDDAHPFDLRSIHVQYKKVRTGL
jgi:hypothetical protein